MPSIDPANPSPWLASLSASRRRRAEAARGRRRKRAGRGGGAVLLAAMTLVAGGAVAADGRRHERRAAAEPSGRRRAPARARHPADGVIGPLTRRALRSYQRNHGLVVDGVAGPATLVALGISAAPAKAHGTGRPTSRGSAHARADRPVRVRRRPDRGLARPAATAASTSSRAPPGATSAAPAIRPGRAEAVQDAIAAKLLAPARHRALAGLRLGALSASAASPARRASAGCARAGRR